MGCVTAAKSIAPESTDRPIWIQNIFQFHSIPFKSAWTYPSVIFWNSINSERKFLVVTFVIDEVDVTQPLVAYYSDCHVMLCNHNAVEWKTFFSLGNNYQHFAVTTSVFTGTMINERLHLTSLCWLVNLKM